MINQIILKSISSKYLGPTNFRGSRVKVTDGHSSMTFDWRSELNSEENHILAITEFAKRKDWLTRSRLVFGSSTDQKGYVGVMIPKTEKE